MDGIYEINKCLNKIFASLQHARDEMCTEFEERDCRFRVRKHSDHLGSLVCSLPREEHLQLLRGCVCLELALPKKPRYFSFERLLAGYENSMYREPEPSERGRRHNLADDVHEIVAVARKLRHEHDEKLISLTHFAKEGLKRKRNQRASSYEFFTEHRVPKYPFHPGATVDSKEQLTELLRKSIVIDNTENVRGNPAFKLCSTDVVYFAYCVGYKVTGTSGEAGEALAVVMAELGVRLGRSNSMAPYPFISAPVRNKGEYVDICRPWMEDRNQTRFYSGVRFLSEAELLTMDSDRAFFADRSV